VVCHPQNLDDVDPEKFGKAETEPDPLGGMDLGGYDYLNGYGAYGEEDYMPFMPTFHG